VKKREETVTVEKHIKRMTVKTNGTRNKLRILEKQNQNQTMFNAHPPSD